MLHAFWLKSCCRLALAAAVTRLRLLSASASACLQRSARAIGNGHPVERQPAADRKIPKKLRAVALLDSMGQHQAMAARVYMISAALVSDPCQLHWTKVQALL